MTPAPDALPLVRRADGRTEPFDPDRIARRIFAALESLGRPDGFLARELTDTCAHFLTAEGDAVVDASRVEEVVTQTLRELGHSALALAMRAVPEPAAPMTLAQTLAAAKRRFSLDAVYSRDLVAACEAGLVTLAGLEWPDRVAGVALGPPLSRTDDLAADVRRAAAVAGGFVALPEPPRADEVFPLADALGETGLRAVVPLNTAPSAPAASGLFADSDTPTAEESRCHVLALLDALRLRECRDITAVYRLRPGETISPDIAARLADAVNRGDEVVLAFDRPRRPVSACRGIDAACPAVLAEVGVHLDALADRPGAGADADRFLSGLGSLVRLALSAGVRKRTFLRGREPLSHGFLLDRARLVVVPVGLDAAVKRFTDWSAATGGPALAFAEKIVSRLVETARDDGRRAGLDVVIDGPPSFALDGATPAGLTAWHPEASVAAQAAAASAMHAKARQGTAAVFVPAGVDGRGITAVAEAAGRAEVVRVAVRTASSSPLPLPGVRGKSVIVG